MTNQTGSRWDVLDAEWDGKRNREALNGRKVNCDLGTLFTINFFEAGIRWEMSPISQIHVLTAARAFSIARLWPPTEFILVVHRIYI